MPQSFWRREARRCWSGRHDGVRNYEQVCSSHVQTRGGLIRIITEVVK